MWENAFALVVWICNAYVIGRELWQHLAQSGRRGEQGECVEEENVIKS